MSTTKTTKPALITLVALTLMLVSTAAFAGELKTHLEGPIVIGDQLFSGGVVSIVDVAFDASMAAILIDGQQVALCRKRTHDTPLAGARPYLVLQRDLRGYQHVLGIRLALKGSSEERAAYRVLEPLVVERGLTTVPEEVQISPTEALAFMRAEERQVASR